MRALHWRCMAAQKLSLCPCPNRTFGGRGVLLLGHGANSLFPSCDTSKAVGALPGTSTVHGAPSLPGYHPLGQLRDRDPVLWFPRASGKLRPATTRNEYWLLGMSQVHAPPSPRVMICWWKLPPPGTPTAELPSTAKSGASVPQTGPGCRGRSTSVSVIFDWDRSVGSPG